MSEESSPKANQTIADSESRANAVAEAGAANKVPGNGAATGAAADDNACVVCFKDVEIYSIGECDHPVCYECSTRMRVLCQQNECPICRQVLSKVIFTYDKLPYRELESKNRSEYYSKKYKIGFYTNKIQQAFFDLLDHQCPKCNVPPYRTFNGLKSHVRKEHDLHYCDICTEHLKIFTFERRCYTQAELGLHRVKGDADNKSHRGHPLCEYCNCRYLDRDELFRHLRRDHYFCHFCDADGYNDFYKDYNALAEHFRQDHFLCEEGKCATEQFTGAFRSEIDYKAHVANVHGKSLNKQQVKQARTLQLEITLGRRGRSGQPEQGIANVRSRGTDETNDELEEAIISQYNAQQQQRSLTIDAQNEQDFPSLGGAAGGPTVSLVRPALISMRNRGTAGLARTKENFPALGGGGGVGETPSTSNVTSQRQAPISNLLKKAGAPSTTGASKARPINTNNNNNNGNNNSTGMVIHVSNRPTAGANNSNNNNNNNNIKSNPLDFPALPAGKAKKYAAAAGASRSTNEAATSSSNLRSATAAPSAPKHRPYVDDFVSLSNSGTFQVSGKSKKNAATANRQLDEDMLPSGSNVHLENVSAKHRILVDDYVSVANPSTFQKLQLIQKEDLDAKARKAAADLNAPKLTTLDFPTLGGSSSKTNSSTWVKATTSEKKQREVENRKSKVAPAPVLPGKSGKSSGNSGTSATHVNYTTTEGTTQKKEDKKKEGKGQDSPPLAAATINKIPKEKNNNNENRPENANLNKLTSSTSTNISNNTNNAGTTRPPPGFSSANTNGGGLGVMKPPPGFQSNVIVNSVAKSPNNLTFTSSLGESYSIVPTHSYIQPPEAISRNQKLVGHFKDCLNTPEALDEFRQISLKFREGVYKAPAYYEHCQAALKDKFDKIFPELLALLPDINKQQALYLVHSQRLKSLSADQRKKLPNLDVCSTCKQVLLSGDFENHKKLHSLKTNFPTLNSTGSNSKATTGNRK